MFRRHEAVFCGDCLLLFFLPRTCLEEACTDHHHPHYRQQHPVLLERHKPTAQGISYFGPRSLIRGETAPHIASQKSPAPLTTGTTRDGTLPNDGRPRDLVHLPNAGMAPDLISAIVRANTRAHRLPDSHILASTNIPRTHAIDGTEPDRLPGAELRGLSDGAMAGG